MVAGQVMIIFIGGRAFSVTRLNGPQWGYSLVLGALSLPVAVVIRLIPDAFVGKFLPPSWRKRLQPEEEVSEEDVRKYALDKRSLTFIKNVRGGRLNQLRFKLEDLRGHFHYDDERLEGAISGVTVA